MNDWIRICREHIANQIEALKLGKFNLHVPETPSHIEYTESSDVHTTVEMFSQISGNHTVSSLELKPGDICIIPAMQLHSGTKTKKEPSLFLVVSFSHGELSFIKGEGRPNEKARGTEILTLKSTRKKIIESYMRNICEISKMKHKAAESALLGLLLTCFSELMIVLDEGKVMDDYNSHPKVYKTQNLVMTNLGDIRLNVDFISKLIPCNPVYLSQLFRKETGIRLSVYINKKRIEYSKQLLKQTSINISEIAYSCGYSDSCYFTRVFRKQIGMSPREYRKH